MIGVKVFTTGNSPEKAGDVLTEKLKSWIEEFPYGIDILDIHSNSNKFGWMLVIKYKELR